MLPGETRTDALIAMQEQGLVPWAGATASNSWGFRVIEIAGHSVPLYFREAFAETADSDQFQVEIGSMLNDGATVLETVEISFHSEAGDFARLQSAVDSIWPHCLYFGTPIIFLNSDWNRVEQVFSEADCNLVFLRDSMDIVRAASFSERNPDAQYQLSAGQRGNERFAIRVSNLHVRETHASAIAAQLDLDPGALDWSVVPVGE